jgi:hypothetical protein
VYNYNLWVTDGDPDSTRIIVPAGVISKSPLWVTLVAGDIPLTVCNGSLYFMARYSDDIGAEPYRLTTETPLGIPETGNEDPALMIYPNPAATEITLKSAADIGRVQLFDLSGRLYFSQAVQAKEVIIQVTTWPAGMYFLQVVSGNEIINRKVLVQH